EAQRAEVAEHREPPAAPAGHDVGEPIPVEIDHREPAALKARGGVLEVDPAARRGIDEARHPGTARGIRAGWPGRRLRLTRAARAEHGGPEDPACRSHRAPTISAAAHTAAMATP